MREARPGHSDSELGFLVNRVNLYFWFTTFTTHAFGVPLILWFVFLDATPGQPGLGFMLVLAAAGAVVTSLAHFLLTFSYCRSLKQDLRSEALSDRSVAGLYNLPLVSFLTFFTGYLVFLLLFLFAQSFQGARALSEIPVELYGSVFIVVAASLASYVVGELMLARLRRYFSGSNPGVLSDCLTRGVAFRKSYRVEHALFVSLLLLLATSLVVGLGTSQVSRSDAEGGVRELSLITAVVERSDSPSELLKLYGAGRGAEYVLWRDGMAVAQSVNGRNLYKKYTTSDSASSSGLLHEGVTWRGGTVETEDFRAFIALPPYVNQTVYGNTTYLSILALLIAFSVLLLFLQKNAKAHSAVRESLNALAGGKADSERLPIVDWNETGEFSRSVNDMLDYTQTLKKKIAEGSKTISIAFGELVSGGRESSNASRRQEEELSSIDQKTEYIRSLAGAISKNALDNREKAEAARTLSQEGFDLQEAVSDRMSEIHTASSHTVELVSNLAAQISRAEEVLSAVGDVSRRTTIVSLNAEIEAARSGHREVAVIAEEIRILSDRAKGAAESTNEILKEITLRVNEVERFTKSSDNKIDEGRSFVVKTVEKFEEMTELVRDVYERTDMVRRSVEEEFDQIKELQESAKRAGDFARMTSKRQKEIQATLERVEKIAKQLEGIGEGRVV